MEEYRVIEGFENYSISNIGNVKKNKTGKILKQCDDGKGYKSVYVNGKNQRVHRLVATAFLPNPENKSQVDHIDGNRSNNNLKNLRWASANENNFNRKITSANTSGYKGIFWDKDKNKWRAQISINGSTQHIGYYDKLDNAVIARYEKAKEIQKDFINACETNQYNVILLKRQKEKELEELEKLEREFTELINKK